jgi:chromate transporter
MIPSTPRTEERGPGDRPVPIVSIFVTFLVIGATSFGGGVAAYIRSVVVDEKGWIDDETFLRGFSLAQILPGPNAANIAIFTGRFLRGTPGAVAAVAAVLLPAILVLSVVSVLYLSFDSADSVRGILTGVGACAVGLIASMALQMQQKLSFGYADYLIAATVFVMVAIARFPVAATIALFVPLAIWLHRPRQKPAGGKPE